MKFFFAGGTGFIGSILSTKLLNDGHKVTMLITPGKKVTTIFESAEFVRGDSSKRGRWQEYIAEQDVIINLAGVPVFKRWSSGVKKEIYDSRILTTRNIVESLQQISRKNIHFFNASGVGYYGYCHDEILDEESPPGDSFLAKVASDWESEALKASTMGVRVVMCRFGLVLGRKGGALKRMAFLCNLFLGGKWGKGEQWFSWIHERDVVESILFLLKHEDIKGPVNLTAPNPVQNRKMTRLLREVLKKKTIVPTIPEALIRGILGEFSEVFLKGQRVIPRTLLTHGYTFQFPTLQDCLEDLLASTR